MPAVSTTEFASLSQPKLAATQRNGRNRLAREPFVSDIFSCRVFTHRCSKLMKFQKGITIRKKNYERLRINCIGHKACWQKL